MFSKLLVIPDPKRKPHSAPLRAQTIFRAAIKTQKFVQCAQFISVANTLDLLLAR